MRPSRLRPALAALFLLLAGAAGEAATLTVTDGSRTRTFETAELLARPDAREIALPHDSAYGAPMTYRAVPLAALLADFLFPPGSAVEVAATDGFAAQLPRALALEERPGHSTAWLAIEPAPGAWPALPRSKATAGPFYVVWLDPAASGVRSEQWPYMVARIAAVDGPERRWPEIGVDPALPAAHPARAGLELFVTQCMACHRMNGAGAAEMGPDLNLPQNPTEYFRAEALPAFLRNPAALRAWPGQKMSGFSPEQLSDAEIARVIAYLEHMAGRKKRP